MVTPEGPPSGLFVVVSTRPQQTRQVQPASTALCHSLGIHMQDIGESLVVLVGELPGTAWHGGRSRRDPRACATSLPQKRCRQFVRTCDGNPCRCRWWSGSFNSPSSDPADQQNAADLSRRSRAQARSARARQASWMTWRTCRRLATDRQLTRGTQELRTPFPGVPAFLTLVVIRTWCPPRSRSSANPPDHILHHRAAGDRGAAAAGAGLRDDE